MMIKIYSPGEFKKKKKKKVGKRNLAIMFQINKSSGIEVFPLGHV